MIVLFFLLVLIPKYPAFLLGPTADCNCPQTAPACPPVQPPCPPSFPSLFSQICPPQLPPIPPPPPPLLPPPLPPPLPLPPQSQPYAPQSQPYAPQSICLPCPPPIPPLQPLFPPSIPSLPQPCATQSLQQPCPCKRKKRSTPVTAVANEYDTNDQALCNNSRIRQIILKNLSSDAKISKAEIYSELKAKQKGDYVVLCSQSSLSFTSDSTNYCVGGNTNHLCYVFEL